MTEQTKNHPELAKKPIGRPRIGTEDDPIVTLTATVRQSDLDYLATVNRNLSKAVRQIIKEHDANLHRSGT